MNDSANATDARTISDDRPLGLYQRRFCSSWRAARAAAHFHLAQGDIEDDCGNGSFTCSAMNHRKEAWAAMTEAKRLIQIIGNQVPRDAHAAAAMLEVAHQMLEERQRDPESTMGEGDVMAILRNVREALSWACDLPLDESGQRIVLRRGDSVGNTDSATAAPTHGAEAAGDDG